MGLFTSNQRKQKEKELVNLIEMIARDSGTEVDIVYHFLKMDLENIYNSKIQVHKLKLSKFNEDFSGLTNKENILRQSISDMENQILKADEDIPKLRHVLIEKTELSKSKSQELEQLQTKLDNITTDIKNIESKKKQVDYDLMMKNHTYQSKTDPGIKKINLLYIIITIAAIITAVILLLRRK